MQSSFNEMYHHIEAPTISKHLGIRKRELYIPTHQDNKIEYYSKPLFWYLSTLQWQYKRKLNGENLRVKWDGNRVVWNGKTNAYQASKKLTNYMKETFVEEIFEERFGRDKTVLLFGEHMGEKVQGNELGLEKPEFVLFDVKIGEFWLEPEDVEEVAKYFWLRTYKDFGDTGQDTLINLISRTAIGDFKEWERIVATPKIRCLQPNGERVICKIKNKDYAIHG